jgi:hypothetical protein
VQRKSFRHFPRKCSFSAESVIFTHSTKHIIVGVLSLNTQRYFRPNILLIVVQYSFDHSQFDSSVIADVASEIEKRPLKRKREDSDHYGFSLSLSRMKHILAIERDAFISDIDDLTISLNLHELETSTKSCTCHPPSIESQSIGARQGRYLPRL